MTKRFVRRHAVLRPLSGMLAIVLLAGGCSTARDANTNRELVWAVPEIDRDPAEQIRNRWNNGPAGRPKLRIERLPASADDQRQLMAIELNAKLPRFDILTLDVVWTGEFAANGWLADLDDLRGTVAEQSLRGPLESAIWKGTLWAAPFTSGAGFLYYRKDLLTGPPPTTWDEVARAVQEARRRSGANISGFVGQGAQYEGLVVNFLEYLWGAGGKFASPNGTDLELSTGPAIRALEFMRDQLQSGGIYAPNFDTMREDDALAAFASGNAVFMRNWPYAYKALSEDPNLAGKVGIAPLPTFEGKGASAAVGGANLAVSRFSRNLEAAERFVEFASSDRDVQIGLGVQSRPPTLTSAYSDERLANKPDMRLLGEVLATANARPATPAWSAISDEIQQHVFPAYKGRRDIADAVKAIQSFLTL